MSDNNFGFSGGGGSGGGGGTLSSVGLSMPSAFNVTNTPLIANGVLNVTGAGTSNQYIRGDGQLATFPTNVGGGSAVVYYLNGSVNQGVFSGDTYYEMSDTAVFFPNADFNISADGYIAQFITDANVPQLPFIPGGAWQFQLYFSASSAGGNPRFYIELYKYDVGTTTFTLIGSNVTAPESITGGTNIDLYTTLVACPQTPLNLTDRVAIRVYVIPSGRTITLHTQDVHICKVTTTFTYGLVSLNGLIDSVQYLQVGTAGSDFNITQSGLDTHVFNLPDASATNRGALTSADWTTFNNKQNALTFGNLTEATSNVLQIFGGTGAVIGSGTQIVVVQSSLTQSGYLSSADFTTFSNKQNALTFGTAGSVQFSSGTALAQDSSNFFWDNSNKRLGIGTNSPLYHLEVNGTIKSTILISPTIYGSTSASGNLELRSTTSATKGYVSFPEAGTNGAYIGTTSFGNQTAIWLNTTPSPFNYNLAASSGGQTNLNGTGLRLTIAANDHINIDTSSTVFFTEISNGVPFRDYDFNTSLHINYPSGSGISSVRFNLKGKQWLAGALALQKEFELTSPTFSFTGASTITTAYNLFVNPPIAGTNATITNNYAAGFGGNVYVQNGIIVGSTTSSLAGTGQVYAQNGFFTNANSSISGVIGYTNSLLLSAKFVGGVVDIATTAGTNIVLSVSANAITISDAKNFVFNTTTGTQIGTGINQKLSFYGSTPITQPTPATTPQGIASALTNLGLLAPSTINSVNLTTTGSSGAASYTQSTNTLNIPIYATGSTSVWNVTTQIGASYSASNNDYVLINASTQIVTLPTASANAMVGVKMINATVTSIQVKTASAGVNIDGVDRSATGLGLYNQYDAYVFVSDGTNWWIES